MRAKERKTKFGGEDELVTNMYQGYLDTFNKIRKCIHLNKMLKMLLLYPKM